MNNTPVSQKPLMTQWFFSKGNNNISSVNVCLSPSQLYITKYLITETQFMGMYITAWKR